jgi:hypothetical protein
LGIPDPFKKPSLVPAFFHPFEGGAYQILMDFVARSTVVSEQFSSIGLGLNQLRHQEKAKKN